MNKVELYYCFNTFCMNSGEVAFEKGRFYKGLVIGEHGNFKSDITDYMNHGMDMIFIEKHLRTFKFGL